MEKAAKGELAVHRRKHGRRVELLLNGQAVSWVEVPYGVLRIGRATLSFGGFGNVFTRREHRGKGYSRRVLQRALAVMAGDGRDLGMLFGIPDFYEKFGFRTALNDYRVEIAGRTVVGGPMSLRARRLPAGRHAEVLPLYRHCLRDVGFGVDRRRSSWPGYLRGATYRSRPIVTAFYRRRKMVGYLLEDDDPKAVRVPELAAADDDVLRWMLTWLGRRCRRKVCEKIEMFLSPTHPASRLAVELGAEFSRTTRATGGGMMRILGLQRTVEKVRPELEARWAGSPLAGRRVEVTFDTDLGWAELALAPCGHRRGPSIRGRVRLRQDRLVQLLVGYQPADRLAGCADVRIPRRLVRAMEILFPEYHPSILPTNCF